MHLIPCPHCGTRDEIEFLYRGDVTMIRPASDADEAAFAHYVYIRDNPKGWHTEWWVHSGGCRQWIKVVRHTVTHEIARTGLAHEQLQVPRA